MLMSNRDQLCSSAEPELWRSFCRMTNRPDMPSDVWLVSDVLAYMEMRRKQNGTDKKTGNRRRNE